jgi:predicted transposase YdaD
VVRVWQLSPDALLRGGLALLPLAPISAVTEAELPGIIQRMEQRLSSRRARQQAPLVWGAAFILLGLRYSPDLAAHLFRRVVSMKESSTYQAILEEGREEGRREGHREGRQEGLAEGAVAEARKVLRIVGDRRFGPPDAQTAAAIERIEELARLEDLCARLESAESWPDLLGSRKGKRRAKPGGSA